MPPEPITATAAPARSLTPREFARQYRLGVERVRGMIVRGDLGALNLAPTRCGRPRYVITPEHVAAFERRHLVSAPPKPVRKRQQPAAVDYYPEVEA